MAIHAEFDGASPFFTKANDFVLRNAFLASRLEMARWILIKLIRCWSESITGQWSLGLCHQHKGEYTNLQHDLLCHKWRKEWDQVLTPVGLKTINILNKNIFHFHLACLQSKIIRMMLIIDLKEKLLQIC